MRRRFSFVALILLALVIGLLTACNSGASEGENTPTAIPVVGVTQTPTAQQVMATPTLEPSITEQVMATPTEMPTEEPEPTSVPTSEAPVEPVSTDAEPPDEKQAEVEPAEAETESTELAEEKTPQTAALTHTVQQGENLYRIGIQHGVNWTVIAEANNVVNPNQVIVGQVLVIPPGSTVEGELGASSPSVHVVQWGENLFRIGLKNNMTWDVIAQANGLTKPNAIFVGQELIIPGN